MPDYIADPLVTDPDELKLGAFDRMREAFPGWEPAEGNLDVWVIEAFAEIAAQLNETGSTVARSIFRAFGPLVGIVPRAAVPAYGETTWTAIDDSGYTIPSGTLIAFDGETGTVAFETVGDAIIAEGATTVSGVTVVAIEPGADGSGFSGAATLVDPLDYIVSVTAPSPTDGGEDAEDDADFLNRLSGELTLLSPRPLLTEDFARLAVTVPGVARAAAVNGMDADGSLGHARMVGIGLCDASGAPVSVGARSAVEALVDGDRVVNTIVNVFDPTYTDLDVDFTVSVYPGFDPDETVEAARRAVANYLSPATWGQPSYGDRVGWSNENTVRYLEVASALDGVEGVNHVESLTLNGTTANVTLSGAFPLPGVATITGAAV